MIRRVNRRNSLIPKPNFSIVVDNKLLDAIHHAYIQYDHLSFGLKMTLGMPPLPL